MAASTLLPHDVWRRSSGLITPPMSTALVSLPPITCFDRRPSQCLPLPSTLPLSQDASDSPLQRYDDDVDVFDPPFQHKPFIPDDAPHLIDWFDSTLKRPASFIAEKTCEMVCYLWFSSPSPSPHISSSHRIPSPPYSPEIPATTSPLQLAPSAAFSVIVLSLHYIWPLKERNRFTNGLPGSEFRIAVAALMMANKFLDEPEEFLTAVDFSLHVSGKQYASWLHLLKGLVLTKETESRKWRGVRARSSRHGRQSQPMTSMSVARTYRWRCQSTSYRARSTSPMRLTNPPASTYHRSATDAFSPTSVSFKELPPLKRPTGMTLQIPETSYHNCPSSGSSPLDSLYSLAKMSLSSSLHAQRSAQSAQSQPRSHVIEGRPQTLVAAYRVDRPVNVPQSLYYYSLAGSSINGDSEQPKGNRKARLRCYQPPPQVPPPSYTSASVSPHDSHVTLAATRQPSLPHLHDAIWARKLSSSNCGSAHTYKKVSPVERDQSLQLPPLRGDGTCAVPSAPFSNAGPPGVQFYAASSTPASQHPHPYHHHHASHHRSSPAYPSPHTRTYGR
ncbi:hypothetical protein BKA83DRAFT_4329187 [Pisolithus microcarpus]|nr:hypothetical protein BKA83DRAFT_4329187 [Pisolithus microcarpus]